MLKMAYGAEEPLGGTELQILKIQGWCWWFSNSHSNSHTQKQPWGLEKENGESVQ